MTTGTGLRCMTSIHSLQSAFGFVFNRRGKNKKEGALFNCYAKVLKIPIFNWVSKFLLLFSLLLEGEAFTGSKWPEFRELILQLYWFKMIFTKMEYSIQKKLVLAFFFPIPKQAALKWTRNKISF